MIIDFHIHLSRAEHEQPWVLDWMRSNYAGDLHALVEEVLTPEGLRRYLQRHDIDWAVGLAEVSPLTTGVTSNEYVGELCAQANALPDPPTGPRGRLAPFASINPFLVRDLAAEVDRLVETYGFRGLKLYPPYHHHYANDARMYPLYARAEELGLPVLVHTGSSVFKGARIKYGDPLLLDDVALDFPNLNILMAHGGRPFWYDQAYWMAHRHANVYLEVSGLPAKRLPDYFPRLREIAHKTVYGSDWPGNPDLRRNVTAIEALPLDEAAKRAILYDNAARLLGIPAREPGAVAKRGDAHA